MSYARGARRRLHLEQDVADETTPLVFWGGYIHIPCGGPAEMPSHRHLGMYCINEDLFGPRSEFKKAGQSTLVGGS